MFQSVKLWLAVHEILREVAFLGVQVSGKT